MTAHTHRVTLLRKPRPKIEPVFVGLAVPPLLCPRERCGQPVRYHTATEEPLAWSCPAGHGGVINTMPVDPPKPVVYPSGTCQSCGGKIPDRRRFGGHKGKYCTECIMARRQQNARDRGAT